MANGATRPWKPGRIRMEPGVHKKSTHGHGEGLLPTKFKPRFWKDSDSRIHVVRLVRKRYQLLMENCGGHESYQRDLLCQRVAFLSCVIETKEVKAAEGEDLDLGSYTQMVNALVGLLRILGLEKRLRNVTDLKAYLDGKTK
jgi:hypothetical protein